MGFLGWTGILLIPLSVSRIITFCSALANRSPSNPRHHAQWVHSRWFPVNLSNFRGFLKESRKVATFARKPTETRKRLSFRNQRRMRLLAFVGLKPNEARRFPQPSDCRSTSRYLSRIRTGLWCSRHRYRCVGLNKIYKNL